MYIVNLVIDVIFWDNNIKRGLVTLLNKLIYYYFVVESL